MKYVYFIKPVGMDGPIKIGCSEMPTRRLLDLSAWSPFKLEIIGHVPGGILDEHFLHGCFADLHSHREWFVAAPRLLSVINEILAAGSIDAVRGRISKVGSINSRAKAWSDSRRLRASYTLKLNAIRRRLRHEDEQGVHCYSEPKEISLLMSKWAGNNHRGIPGIDLTSEEMASLDDYILNHKKLAVHVLYPRKVAA